LADTLMWSQVAFVLDSGREDLGVGTLPPVRSDAAHCKISLTFFTLPPVGGRGIVFGRFLSFVVSLSSTLRENGWTDLHEIFREGVE